MADGRKSKPRVRPTRPIGVSKVGGPVRENPPIEPHNDGWFIATPLSNRLYQKSAIGKPIDGGIVLTDEEAMFCHWHRHVPLPDGWVDERLEEDPNFAHKSVAFDVVRNAGEKVVPVGNEWLRWPRESHPSRGQPQAAIHWARTQDDLNIESLLEWSKDLGERGLLGEVAIVDDEMDVTMYRLSIIDPRGSLKPATRDNYPLLGVEHLSRKFLRKEETDWINGLQNSATDLFDELNSRGLLLRPGFKYGCRWRVYTTPVDVDHAPWLMQMEDDAPKNWEGVCLSVRLAEGVNKGWVVAIFNEGWNFLLFSRHLPGR